MKTRILIGADLVPTQRNYEYFKVGNIEKLVGVDLKEKLEHADYSIFNLEVPLTDEALPISKSGPNLIAPSYTIKGLKKINPCFFTLANNHIMDQGKQGLDSTIELLRKEGIAYAGAGFNLQEASRSYIAHVNDIDIGIYCCAEHEFSIAKEQQAGANPFDPIESFDHVLELSSKCDYLIVLYHGGKEYYRYPSPNLQKVCRKFVEKGANLVVCQHSHCIGAAEEWKVKDKVKGIIVYGQGNFLFDYSDNECWKTGLLIEIELEIKNQLQENINYIPLEKKDEFVRMADINKAEEVLNKFMIRSNEIKDESIVETYYEDFSKKILNEYLHAMLGKKGRNIVFRIINRLSRYKYNEWYVDRKYKQEDYVLLSNYIECEAHREVLLQGLKTKMRENEKPKAI